MTKPKPKPVTVPGDEFARYRKRLVEKIADNLEAADRQRERGYRHLADWYVGKAEGHANSLFLAGLILLRGADPSIESTDAALDLGRQMLASRSGEAAADDVAVPTDEELAERIRDSVAGEVPSLTLTDVYARAEKLGPA